VNAIGRDHDVGTRGVAVGKAYLNLLIRLHKVDAATTNFHAIAGRGVAKRRQKVGPMDLVIAEPELTSDRLAERRRGNELPVVPTSEFERIRRDGDAFDCRRQAKPVENSCAVGTKLDTCANFSEAARLQNERVSTGGAAQQRRVRGREP